MVKQITITEEYFRQYRQKLGFYNQIDAKNFFGAKDITPNVDFEYIKILNKRLCDIVDKINKVVADKIKNNDLGAFKKEHINKTFKIMRKSGF